MEFRSGKTIAFISAGHSYTHGQDEKCDGVYQFYRLTFDFI